MQCRGLELVPEEYRRIVKDIAIQAVRNAIVHGIEPAAVRVAAGKPSQGAVRLEFKGTPEGGYKLSIEDDGQGLATERIKEVALQKGFVTPDQAQNLDTKTDSRIAVPAGLLDPGERDQGCGPRRGHEFDGGPDAPGRRTRGGRDGDGKVHARDHDIAGRRASRRTTRWRHRWIRPRVNRL